MEKLSQFVVDLDRCSRIAAKRSNDEVVTKRHVESALEFLGTGPARRFARHLGTLGGIFLGAGLSQLLAMLTSDQYTGLAVTITVGLCLVGSGLVIYHVAKD